MRRRSLAIWLAPAATLGALFLVVVALGQAHWFGGRSSEACATAQAAIASPGAGAERIKQLLPAADALARQERPDAVLHLILVAWDPVPTLSFFYSGQNSRPPTINVDFGDNGPRVRTSDFVYPNYRDGGLDLAGLEVGAEAARMLTQERNPGFSALTAILKQDGCDLIWRVLAVRKEGEGKGLDELQVDVRNPGGQLQTVDGFPTRRQIFP
jgi:hypothetical protein